MMTIITNPTEALNIASDTPWPVIGRNERPIMINVKSDINARIPTETSKDPHGATS